ncbi:ester cyclase [Streptomyces sp. NPDC006235]|uniref:ester cyclase n=1 Tax=Streptomyces sp. NPDC006235 TaxID=3156736 RepID=UPI0033B5BB0F
MDRSQPAGVQAVEALLACLAVPHHWTAAGTYAGGFPGAKTQPGTDVTFTGTDTLRIKNGKFVEYWLNSDTLQLLTQLHAL